MDESGRLLTGRFRSPISDTRRSASRPLLEAHPQIRVLFTDIEMPGSMDGLKLAAYVRNRWPPVSIIVTSGGIRPGEGLLPPDGVFLAKPYRSQDLASHLRVSCRPCKRHVRCWIDGGRQPFSAPSVEYWRGICIGDIVIETPWLIATGLAALLIATAAVVAKLRSSRRASNRIVWRQWRRA